MKFEFINENEDFIILLDANEIIIPIITNNFDREIITEYPYPLLSSFGDQASPTEISDNSPVKSGVIKQFLEIKNGIK